MVLHAHRVVAAVDVQRGTRDVPRRVAQEVAGRRADVLRLDVAAKRRALLDDRLHRRKAGDRTRGERTHGAGRHGVHADVPLAEVPGEVLDRRVERRLRDTHHVVVRYRPLAAEIGHRDDRAAAGLLHQRLRGARAGYERVRADVDRHPEPVPGRVREPTFEVLGGGEGDRVHEQIELPAEGLARLRKHARDVVIRTHVAFGDERRIHGRGEVPHVLLDALALKSERELRSAFGEHLRDRPCDRALVGDSENESFLALEFSGHRRDPTVRSAPLRRAIPLLAGLAALVWALPVNAAVQRVRVVVELPDAPLAASGERGLAQAGSLRRLNEHTQSSRTYVRTLERRQAVVARQIRAAIPGASIGRRFAVVLDALTVTLPVAELPTLVANPSVTKVYPSVAYHLATNRSPTLIGADVLRASAGADGRGVKIAVIDDGIDQSNPFFNPAGFTYPTGFPRGSTRWTTPKVIVARVFPGPNAGAAGRLALDPNSSFHGTHVAGIAGGVAGTTAPAGADHPRTTGLSGVAPRAWLGNYRVFTVPTPIGHVANTPEIVAAFEAAVSDGMDVINFSGGGPQVDPANDALVAAVHAVAAAGVVPVIAAGNDRDDFGVGSVGSPGTAPDAISVAAVSNTYVFAPALDVTAAGGPKGIPFMGANGERAPVAWGDTDQTLVDVGTRAERHLCKPLAKGSLAGAIVLVQRGLCPFNDKADRARAAGAKGIVFFDNREGEANGVPAQLSIPGGMIANLDGRRLIDFVAAHGGRTTIRVGRAPLELDTGRSRAITSFSPAGPTAFGHLLKPDVSAPGGQIPSSTLPRTDASR